MQIFGRWNICCSDWHEVQICKTAVNHVARNQQPPSFLEEEMERSIKGRRREEKIQHINTICHTACRRQRLHICPFFSPEEKHQKLYKAFSVTQRRRVLPGCNAGSLSASFNLSFSPTAGPTMRTSLPLPALTLWPIGFLSAICRPTPGPCYLSPQPNWISSVGSAVIHWPHCVAANR